MKTLKDTIQQSLHEAVFSGIINSSEKLKIYAYKSDSSYKYVFIKDFDTLKKLLDIFKAKNKSCKTEEIINSWNYGSKYSKDFEGILLRPHEGRENDDFIMDIRYTYNDDFIKETNSTITMK